jgi:uncharacterized membrane protein YhaH (DUF805 family)
VLKTFLQNLLSAEGRINRIEFLHSFIFMLCLFILLSIINREYIRQTDDALMTYLYIKSLQSMLLLAFWTPSLIKRLHDIDIRGNRVIIAWAALLLDAHNLMLLNIHIAALLEKLQPVLFIFYSAVLIFYLVLFLMPGTNGINNWGSPQQL